MRLGSLAAVAGLVAAAACDGGLQPVPVCSRNLVGACGTARFVDTLPDQTDAVFIVAFPTFPTHCDDLLTFPPTFRPFPPNALPRPYVDSTIYELELPPDQYAWVVAVWKKVGNVTLSRADTAIFRVAGDYRDPSDTTQRGAITVPSGGAVGDVHVRVDFGNLRTVDSFVPCTAQ
jgi:hypothetical protein